MQTFYSSSSSSPSFFSSNFLRRQRAPLAGLHQNAESQTSPSRCEVSQAGWKEGRAGRARASPLRAPGQRHGLAVAQAQRPPSPARLPARLQLPECRAGQGGPRPGAAAARHAGRCSHLPPSLSGRRCGRGGRKMGGLLNCHACRLVGGNPTAVSTLNWLFNWSGSDEWKFRCCN